MAAAAAASGRDMPQFIAGIDLGTALSTISLVDTQRRVSTVVANDVSKRETPSVVGYDASGMRLAGEGAATQQMRNRKGTVSSVKRLLGLIFSDNEKMWEDEKSFGCTDASAEAGVPAREGDGMAEMRISIGGGHGVEPTQLCATLVQHLCGHADRVAKEDGGWLLQHACRWCGIPRGTTKWCSRGTERSGAPVQCDDAPVTESRGLVDDVVVATPAYFTGWQREAVTEVVMFARRRCFASVEESEAIAADYAFHRDLPMEAAAAEPPERIVVVVDIGASATTITATRFIQPPDRDTAVKAEEKAGFPPEGGEEKCDPGLTLYRNEQVLDKDPRHGKIPTEGRAEMLVHIADPYLGCRDFDSKLLEHFKEETKRQYKIDVSKDRRGEQRLRLACEQLRRQLSANSSAPLRVESLTPDVDANFPPYTRQSFEQKCQNQFGRLRELFVAANGALRRRGQGSRVDVELVGGGTRMPKVRELVKKVFGQEAKCTLNAAEAVARGAGVIGLLRAEAAAATSADAWPGVCGFDRRSVFVPAECATRGAAGPCTLAADVDVSVEPEDEPEEGERMRRADGTSAETRSRQRRKRKREGWWQETMPGSNIWYDVKEPTLRAHEKRARERVAEAQKAAQNDERIARVAALHNELEGAVYEARDLFGPGGKHQDALGEAESARKEKQDDILETCGNITDFLENDHAKGQEGMLRIWLSKLRAKTAGPAARVRVSEQLRADVVRYREQLQERCDFMRRRLEKEASERKKARYTDLASTCDSAVQQLKATLASGIVNPWNGIRDQRNGTAAALQAARDAEALDQRIFGEKERRKRQEAKNASIAEKRRLQAASAAAAAAPTAAQDATKQEPVKQERVAEGGADDEYQPAEVPVDDCPAGVAAEPDDEMMHDRADDWHDI